MKNMLHVVYAIKLARCTFLIHEVRKHNGDPAATTGLLL